MTIFVDDLREHVIRPTLTQIGLWSVAAENLLLGTCAQESLMGRYLKQRRNGPALGIYQIEPKTHEDVIKNYLQYRKPLAKKIFSLGKPYDQSLIFNLAYSTAIARVIYYRIPKPLPDADDVEALAKYYKQHYNTEAGKATPEQFIYNYKRYVHDE